MCNFTKIEYKMFVLLEREISCHLHLIFDRCINSAKKELTEIIPGSKNSFDILTFQMEERFTYLMTEAFRFGIDHSDSDLDKAVKEYLVLLPDEVSTGRIRKAVDILAEEIDSSDLFSQFLSLLQQAYSLEPYLEQIIEAGMDAQNGAAILTKKLASRCSRRLAYGS